PEFPKEPPKAGPPLPPPTPPRTATTQTMRPTPEPHTTGQQPPVATPPKAPPPQGPPKPPSNWKKPLILGGLLGAIVSIVLIVLVVNQARKKNAEKKETTNTVEVSFTTTPPNASIRVNGESRCASPCKLPLAPGTYQIIAFLDGYDAATNSVEIVAGQPANVNL